MLIQPYLFRALKPAAVLFYAANFAYGIMFGISDGLLSFYLLDDLNISQKYYGNSISKEQERSPIYTLPPPIQNE